MITETDPRIVALLASYARVTGKPLCEPGALFEAPFPVLAHGTETPPVFFYGNRAALTLWERTWDEWVGMPSRETAEPDAREVREALLAKVARDGFFDGYTGVRVSKSGRRFFIENALVWNVVDAEGVVLGQAATFATSRVVG
jgi:hypothetical protein